MKVDAECNETTPVTSFDLFHEDFTIFTKMTPEYCIYTSNNNIKSEVRNASRTDMESATFKTVKTTVDLAF